ncbi:NACHT domain-containing protein [Croceimicrobium hydrocarbonivorans]|uniref:NACHT domain-containing protein n=1 Tax=Croceimicrobium hydrocarbonivorans TaxID=2761580 RepID=A0A7H0VBR7_9FLAO|nr:NACHT domain-containing protein [Croceimicrobium hydrocarbonivorans]QNR23165.1 NACHT domain-containing protein [Croceimicrobium hydrocarbonivorans]
MTNKEEKLAYLHSIKKETEIHTLLEELLPELGYSDVIITHEKGNEPEYGKDLVCSKMDDIEGKKDWIAFVVKKGKVSGSAGVVKEIDDQVAECFEYPYKSLHQTKTIPINKVKVVTNQHFSSGAKNKIFNGNAEKKANIDFWDDEKLVYFIDKYYPKYWLQGSKQYKKYVERIQERIKSDSLVKSLSIDDKKSEKFLNSIIEPKLSERITNEDGSIKWVGKKSNTIITIPDNSIIIGEPGSGKSTLFKSLSNEIITQNSLRNHTEFYPVILTFKEVASTGFDLEKALEYFFSKDWLEDLSIDVSQILKTNSCVIFIDALDELPQLDLKEKALDAIGEFKTNFPEIRVICSSRPSDYLFHNCETAGFRYLEINDLNREQVESFLYNYFGENVIKSKSLLKSLKDSEILEKLPKTPLTIALITILFDEKEVEIPATISDLYENFVNLLIGKVTAQDSFDLIESGAKHRILCHIAKSFHVSLKRSMPRGEVEKLISDYALERGQSLESSKMLNELLDQIGLLYLNDKEEIEFKHQSFQEYFTAFEIFHHRQADRSLFVDKFNDLWWQNVAIFFAGMSKDAPQLLNDILSHSSPQTLSETITNIGGIGKLLQALYNTPIEAREKGIETGLQNTYKAVNKIEVEQDEHFDFWKNFSTYGLMQILGGWFMHNYWSVTLQKPLENWFDSNIQRLEANKDDENLEYMLYLTSGILASDDFQSFERLEKLVSTSSLKNLNLLATYDTHLKRILKHLPKEFKRNEDLKSIQRKLKKKIRAIPSFAEIVNEPIKAKLKE